MKKLVQMHHHSEGEMFPDEAYVTFGKKLGGFYVMFRWFFYKKLKKGMICPVTFKRVDTVCYPVWIFVVGNKHLVSASSWVPIGQYTIEPVE